MKEIFRIFLLAVVISVFLSVSLLAITCEAQIPIPNTNVEINYWQVTFWEIDLGDGILEITAGDTITLAWDQPLSLATEDYIEVVPPDSQIVISFSVYTYDVSPLIEADTASIEYKVYTLEVLPGDYCVSVRAFTMSGINSAYGEPFPFRVISEYPIMYPVRIKIIIK